MRLLDLFSCAGGAAVGYHRAGFEVVGVDIDPQPNYPYEHHVGDALLYAAEHGHRFDAIHASPPCQTHSALTEGNRKRPGWSDDHVDLIPETRVLLDRIGKPYVIENVAGAPIRKDVMLCGEMFGLAVIRHRFFELGGWSASAPAHPPHRGRVQGWRHGVHYDGPYFAVHGDGGGKGSVADWQAAMGIDWTGVKREIAEALPPVYTEYVGRALMEHL